MGLVCKTAGALAAGGAMGTPVLAGGTPGGAPAGLLNCSKALGWRLD